MLVFYVLTGNIFDESKNIAVLLIDSNTFLSLLSKVVSNPAANEAFL